MSEREPWFPSPGSGYFHVRKSDVHARSARDADPPFESFDVVLRRDYDALAQALSDLRARYDHSADECEGECVTDRSRVVSDIDALVRGAEVSHE